MNDKTRRFSLEELRKMKGKTDWARVDNTSDDDIRSQVGADPDLALPTEDELNEFVPANKTIALKREQADEE